MVSLTLQELKAVVIKDNGMCANVVILLKQAGLVESNILVARNREDARILITRLIESEEVVHLAVVDPGLDSEKEELLEGIDCIQELRDSFADCYIICLTGASPPPNDGGRQKLAMDAGASH